MIPLIRQYLPFYLSSLERLDSIPSFVIKKNTSYMAIATDKLKYLDLCNFLAAGTSLESFYQAYNVATVKGKFPYDWFSDLSKLQDPKLPSREDFFSKLTLKVISNEEYLGCIKVWEEENMSRFEDYVRERS